MSKEERARTKLAADPLPESPYLQVGEELILVKCGFSEQLLQLLRWIPKLEWRPDLRGWTLPISSAETLRSVLPEVLRLAEATEEIASRLPAASAPEAATSPEDLFKSAARLLFGSDWQRETARALGRDETGLARFLLGERALEDAGQLYADMLALMRRRAAEIAAAADRFAVALAPEPAGDAKPPQPPTDDQGI
jgi:hypothetical protein